MTSRPATDDSRERLRRAIADFSETPSPALARQYQTQLAPSVVLQPPATPVALVAGVDMGFPDQGKTARAAVCLYSLPDLEPVQSTLFEEPVRFPYVPGLLSFRELPTLLKALAELDSLPDLFLCDGQGIAHPRRLGIAAHLGVLLDLPSIGVGKSRLIGEHDEPGFRQGEQTHLVHKGERIGTVLRTRDHVKPVYVSPGHRMDHKSAVDWVLKCCTKYRLPEPIRAADKLASRK